MEQKGVEFYYGKVMSFTWLNVYVKKTRFKQSLHMQLVFCFCYLYNICLKNKNNKLDDFSNITLLIISAFNLYHVIINNTLMISCRILLVLHWFLHLEKNPGFCWFHAGVTGFCWYYPSPVVISSMTGGHCKHCYTP